MNGDYDDDYNEDGWEWWVAWLQYLLVLSVGIVVVLVFVNAALD